MATMTILEAENILDIVSEALQGTRHRHHPISALKGYDIFQVCIALRLRIANEFLHLAGKDDFEKEFTDGLTFYSSIPWQVMRSFVPDNQVESIAAVCVFTISDLAPLEAEESFGDYCKNIGSKDPLYWQKIYTRLGLEYSASSPRCNDPVFLT